MSERGDSVKRTLAKSARDARAIHGTETAYVRGCRCERCRAASALAQRLRRAGKGPGKPTGQQVHSARGYKAWGCRCDICTAGNREMCRAYRERARARARAREALANEVSAPRSGANQKDRDVR